MENPSSPLSKSWAAILTCTDSVPTEHSGIFNGFVVARDPSFLLNFFSPPLAVACKCRVSMRFFWFFTDGAGDFPFYGLVIRDCQIFFTIELVSLLG